MNTRSWLARSPRNNFPLIGRLIWLVVEWLTLERRINAFISLTMQHRLIFFRLESARHSPCSSWSLTNNMLVLFSTLWLASAVLRAEGTLFQSDSAFIFDNISRPVRVSLIHPVTARISLRRDSSVCSLLTSPNLSPESVLLWTGSSVGFRSLELITVCRFNRRNN